MLPTLRLWLSFKILFISLLFLAVNILFYWGLFFQVDYQPQTITPILSFSQEAPLYISRATQQEKTAQFGQILNQGDQIITSANQFAEVHMGENKLRLGPNTHIRLISLYFNPQPSYESEMFTMVVQLEKGELWINAFDPLYFKAERYDLKLSHSLAFIENRQENNNIAVFKGLAELYLKDTNQNSLTQLSLPLLSESHFSNDQLTSDFAFLKPSKLKKELKVGNIDPLLLNDPWISFYQLEEGLFSSRNIRPNYSNLLYNLHNLGNSISQLLSWNKEKSEQIWFNRAKYTVKYWLGSENKEGGEENNSFQQAWVELGLKLGNNPFFKEWLNRLFFQIPWGDLGSNSFILKETILKDFIQNQGPYVLRELINQTQIALSQSQIGRAQRFSQKWLNEWKQQDIKKHQDELYRQFQMMQQLGIHYSNQISPFWLTLLDQSSDLLLKEWATNEEFELALTQDRLAQVAALIEVYRYDFAKEYLRSSYQKLPIVSTQELSPSEEVFFELGKLLAQRIEYAQITFKGAPLPIDEESFSEFVRQSKQSDLLSNDLNAFLSAEKPQELAPASFLPSVDVLIETLQSEGLVLNETHVQLSKEEPFAFQLRQVVGKNLNGVEKTFDALYFPLNNSFNQMVVEGESIQGIFKLSNLSKALSLPELLKNENKEDVQDFSDLFSGTQQQPTPQQRAAEELARQLAFNQITQAGFTLLSPQTIKVPDPKKLERVTIHSASLDLSSGSLVVDLELNTEKQTAYQVKNSSTQQLYFDEIELKDLTETLSNLIEEKKAQEKGLILLNQALESQPVFFNQESVRFLDSDTIEVAEITLTDLNLTFSGLFEIQENQFSSLAHPLYSLQASTLDQYIPDLMKAYVKDFFDSHQLPSDTGNWQPREPLNRIRVSNYLFGKNVYSFTLNLTAGHFENIQMRGETSVVEKLTPEEFKQLIQNQPFM